TGLAARAQQEPERLGEDRLARPRLAGDRVEPGRQLELRVPDEHEVLDAEPTNQRSVLARNHALPTTTGRSRIATLCSRRERSVVAGVYATPCAPLYGSA